MIKNKKHEWTGTLVTPAHYLCTGVSRDPPKSAYYAVNSICRKHTNCDTPGMITDSSIIHLMLVTRHTAHTVERQRPGQVLEVSYNIT